MGPLIPRIVWLWALVGLGLSLCTALGPLGGLPHVNDEIVYTLQARLFAAGARTGPPAFAPELLDFPMWEAAPRAYGVFPPGWPALLAVGEALGLPWLVNPLLALALPPLGYLLARERADETTAVTAAAVLALSPGVWILAASRMSQTSVLVALALAAVVVARGRDPFGAWIGAALAVAYVVLARPFDAAVVGGPLLMAGLWRAPGWRARVALLLAPGLAAALLLADNLALTGDALVFPVNAWFDRVSGRPGCNRLGFGADVGCQATLGTLGHTPDKALTLARLSAERLERLLLGVPGGGLLALGGLLLLRRRVAPLLLLGLLPVVAYTAYWSPGAAYGARFWHPLYLALPLLVAAPLARLAGRFAPLLLLAAVALGLPALHRDLGDRYWCVDDQARRALADAGADEGLVLIQARGQREAWWPALRVAMDCDPAMERGDLVLDLDPLGRGLQPRRAPADRAELDAILAAWPADRPAWLVQHDVAADRVRVLRIR